MKIAQIITLIIITFSIFSCKENKSKNNHPESIQNYDSFGKKITDNATIDNTKMLEQFNQLKIGDTLTTKFTSSIHDVCSKKGCWMKLTLANDKEVMVRFKDYGFFMPLDSKGKTAIVNGKAYIKEVSVKELQHYAEDAGKSKEEIAKIIAPEITYSFEADGVLIKK